MIFFSVQFRDNSLLVLKMRLQVFSFTSKKVQGFPSDRKILMSLLSVLFHLQNHVSVFWDLFLDKISGETFIMSLKSSREQFVNPPTLVDKNPDNISGFELTFQ